MAKRKVRRRARKILGEEPVALVWCEIHKPIPAPPKDVPDMAWAARYLRELRAIVGPMRDMSSAEHALRGGMDGSYFSSRLSKLRSALDKHLGPAASAYRIDDGGKKPHRYRLALEAEAVQLLEPNAHARLR